MNMASSDYDEIPIGTVVLYKPQIDLYRTRQVGKQAHVTGYPATVLNCCYIEFASGLKVLVPRDEIAPVQLPVREAA